MYKRQGLGEGRAEVAAGGGEEFGGGRSVDLAEDDEDGVLDLAAGGGERGLDLLVGRAGGQGHDAAGAGAQLLVGGAHVDHEVPVGLAQADHGDRRDEVEDEFLRGAGLEAGGAGEQFGSDDDLDAVVGRGGERGAGVAGQADGERPAGAGGLDGADRVRGPAGGGDADDGVVRADVQRGQVLGGQLLGVLGALDGLDHGGGAARDQADDVGRVGVEGGRALAGVQDTHPAGRAGTGVDEAAAAGHALGDRVDGGGDLRQPGGDGGRDGGVLGVHGAGDVEGGQPVDLGEFGPEGLGGQRLQLGAEFGVRGHGGSLRRFGRGSAVGCVVPVARGPGGVGRILPARRCPVPHLGACRARPYGTPSGLCRDLCECRACPGAGGAGPRAVPCPYGPGVRRTNPGRRTAGAAARAASGRGRRSGEPAAGTGRPGGGFPRRPRHARKLFRGGVAVNPPLGPPRAGLLHRHPAGPQWPHGPYDPPGTGAARRPRTRARRSRRR